MKTGTKDVSAKEFAGLEVRELPASVFPKGILGAIVTGPDPKKWIYLKEDTEAPNTEGSREAVERRNEEIIP